MSFQEFQLIAPPFTPFDAQGRLAVERIAAQAELAARTTVDGVFIAGSTGECASLTVAERKALAEHWMEVTAHIALDVIVQVGHSCQADALELAAHAQQIGVDAVSAHAPSYFRPQHVDALIDFLVPIAAAAGDLPFYFYDIPPTTGVRLPMVEFLHRAKTRIPNLAGLKYSNEDLVQLQECLAVNHGEFRVMFGCDEILMTGAVLGVHGAIGSTYNFAAPLYRRLLAALDRADFDGARQCQLQSVSIIRAMARYGFLPACKLAMTWFGAPCGPSRAPFQELSPAQQQSLRSDLERLGVFDPAFLELPARTAPAGALVV